MTEYVLDCYVPIGAPTYSAKDGEYQCVQAICLENPNHPTNYNNC
jgi:hypothetical protein